MSITSLVPGALYWASSPDHFGGRLTVVQVSTVFGDDPSVSLRQAKLQECDTHGGTLRCQRTADVLHL